jgi:peptidoglycan/LPS O-acetylase OafA/YrhL
MTASSKPAYSHLNNFNFLRLLFSSLVMLGHSFVLTGYADPLSVVSHSQTDFGTLSVKCFFIISGHLVFTSLRTSLTSLNYVWKRVLRIFPALIVLLFITELTMPLFYEGITIFNEPSYWSYFPNCLSLFNVQYEVKDVFAHNKLPYQVNGSLWTLCYEFSLYLFLLFLFPFRHSKKLFYLLVALTLLSYFMYFNHAHIFRRYFVFYKFTTFRFYRFSTFFMMGCVFSLIDIKWLSKSSIKIIIVILLMLAVNLNLYKRVEPILLTPFVLMIGTVYSPFLARFTKRLGDISYGVYIYGFFVQQGLLYYLDLGPLTLFCCSIIITFILGYLSWVLVESKALQYKALIS